ncbi:hypothetical protein FQR65_LT18765 [Abscondita terminalis]|nr:hypothetical protein FQR65_LT18765 [Abscondita terminalis]
MNMVGLQLGIPNINEISDQDQTWKITSYGYFQNSFVEKKKGIEGLSVWVVLLKHTKIAGIKGADVSWMLEHNYMMNHAIEQ